LAGPIPSTTPSVTAVAVLADGGDLCRLGDGKRAGPDVAERGQQLAIDILQDTRLVAPVVGCEQLLVGQSGTVRHRVLQHLAHHGGQGRRVASNVHLASPVLPDECGLCPAVAHHGRHAGVHVLEELVRERHLVTAEVSQRNQADVGRPQERRHLVGGDRRQQVEPVGHTQRAGPDAQLAAGGAVWVRNRDDNQVGRW